MGPPEHLGPIKKFKRKVIGGFVRLEGVRLGEVDGIWLEIGSAIPGDLVGNAARRVNMESLPLNQCCRGFPSAQLPPRLIVLQWLS